MHTMLLHCAYIYTQVRVLMTPVLLNMGDQKVLGYVLSTSGLGALFGSVILAITGGPKTRKVLAVLGCAAAQGVLLAACGM
jgi:MFS transporter, DHA3 family, macrolide efflux protein